MAQDFGDDMGNALLNFVTRQTENYLRFGRGRERAFDWWQRHYKKEGNTPEQAKAMAEKQSSREQVVVPFGTSEEAAYYAQVCRENGTYAAAYTDKQGNGFLAFAKEDAKTVAGYAPQFKDAVSLPFWCVGFVKPCGMPFEQFAPLWLKANFTNDRIFYKPSMRLAGLLSESENSKQKGTIYGKHYRKQGNLRGIESYSPRAGRVIS